jgi:hypothetical protein
MWLLPGGQGSGLKRDDSVTEHADTDLCSGNVSFTSNLTRFGRRGIRESAGVSIVSR